MECRELQDPGGWAPATKPTPGYSAQTRVKIGRLWAPCLLDFGATCASMPAELFLEVANSTSRMIKNGSMVPVDVDYSFQALEKFDSAIDVHGIKKDNPVQIQYGSALRAEFPPIAEE